VACGVRFCLREEDFELCWSCPLEADLKLWEADSVSRRQILGLGVTDFASGWFEALGGSFCLLGIDLRVWKADSSSKGQISSKNSAMIPGFNRLQKQNSMRSLKAFLLWGPWDELFHFAL
jgi:hypothetical protein